MEEQSLESKSGFSFNLSDVTNYLSVIFDFLLITIIVLIPLFFWNQTSEFFETPKFLILTILAGVMLIIWAIRCVVSGKVTLTKTPLDLPLLLFLVVLIISTIFAQSKTIALFGNLPRINGGLLTFVVYILLYFIIVSNVKKIDTVKQVINILLGVGILLSILSLLAYAGIKIIPLDFAGSLNFTPTGSNFSTTAILALLLPFPLISLISGKGQDILGGISNEFSLNAISQKIIISLILALFAITIVLTGTLATYIAAVAAIILVLVTNPPISIQKNIIFLVVPVILSVVILFASYVPIGGSNNFFYTQAQNFPKEIQLPFQMSWKISISAFRDNPFWGTGPGTYLFNFTNYKPVEFNATKFWNIRFDQSFNEYLQILGTLGALGLIALLLLTAIFLSSAFKSLTSAQGSLSLSLAIACIVFFVLLFLHASTLILWVLGIIFLAFFMIINKQLTHQVHLGLTSPSERKIDANGETFVQFDILPMIILVAVVAFVGVGFYFITYKFALADYHHRQALNSASKGQLLNAYNSLITAEQINPDIDLYRVDLAQTNFAMANLIASSKGPTEASPSGSLTDEDKTTIQQLLSQAISEGRNATVLSPRNSANWEVLGSIYRQISGVAQNALSFSLDSYGRAIQNDPLNPGLRLAVGGIYYSAKSYDMAIRFFGDAVNLKPDYANAYFNLAVAYKDKGDLVSAASATQQVVSLLDQNSEDYKVANQFLEDLKTQIASESAKQQAEAAEAQQGTNLQTEGNKTSALQEKNLPKVLDLPKAENISTPAAIKKPTSTQ
ncbi:MAG: O-antigen ligase family protein [Candidatus Daviesbacteria bacterium]|nr:O-antigen ligase family protein [Candidatus Daviesbacteria bacterium]